MATELRAISVALRCLLHRFLQYLLCNSKALQRLGEPPLRRRSRPPRRKRRACAGFPWPSARSTERPAVAQYFHHKEYAHQGAEPSIAVSISPTTPRALSRPHAALRWHGYRSENRYIKCNLAEYEGHLEVDQALVEGLVAATELLKGDIPVPIGRGQGICAVPALPVRVRVKWIISGTCQAMAMARRRQPVAWNLVALRSVNRAATRGAAGDRLRFRAVGKIEK
jgi:hypothetical protein